MKRTCLHCLVVLVGMVLLASTAGAADLEGLATEAARTEGEALEITWKGVEATDELFVRGFGVQPMDTAAMRWHRELDNPADRSWRVTAGRAQRATAMYEVALLLPGDSVLVGINRLQDDGSTLQVVREIRRMETGELWLGPEARGVIRKRVRVTVDAASRTGLGIVPADEHGRIHFEANDPRLAGLVARGAEIEPYMEAAFEVQTAGTAVGSINISPDGAFPSTWNSNCYSFGITAGTITTASPTAEIVSADLTYQITHSVDVEALRVSGVRNEVGYHDGSAWVDMVIFYSGDQSGFKTLSRSVTGITAWAGAPVNQAYAVGACNLSGHSNENFTINSWTYTIYFTEGGGGGGTVDLVADTVGVSNSSLSPGSAFSATYSGRVQGTGSVGGPFSLGFYLSNDTNITTADTLLGQRTESVAQNPGDTFSMGAPGVNLVIPGGTADGTYYVGFIVDDAGAITESNEGNNVAWTQISVSSGGSYGCVANATTLCLNDDRFKVTADWVTTQPQSGQGQAYELTADTGYFWFFNQENVETVIKVLDGCANNSRYWVFAGGLTNVQVTLRVEDMKNNTVKTYTNPQSTPFQPILDTGAFATCP